MWFDIELVTGFVVGIHREEVEGEGWFVALYLGIFVLIWGD